jgi:type IV pilus assembly protein PilQ
MKRIAKLSIGLTCLAAFCAVARADENILTGTPPPADAVVVAANEAPPSAPVPVAATVTATAQATTVVASDDSTIVIDYNDADIQNVLRTLATKAGVNLLLGDEVVGKVTVRFEGVGYEDAIKHIVEMKGYAYVKEGTIAKVRSKDALESEPVEIHVYTLNYAKADDVAKAVTPSLGRQGKVQVDARSNSLILLETPTNLKKLMPLVEKLDTQTPQVMIEAKFVETTKNPKKDLGINWGPTLLNHKMSAGPFTVEKNLDGGPWVPSTALLDAGSMEIVFSYLARDTDTELLANPRIVTTDNGKAKISIATQFPIPQYTFSEQTASLQISGFDYKDIGIVLNVTPRINKNDFITLEVMPEASSQSGTTTLRSGGAGSAVEIPIVDARTAQTTVLIKSGNTLAIGGLMRQDTSELYTKVPILGDIPGLGVFFRSKSLEKLKRDLLIFVTPSIVNPEAQMATGYEKHYNGFEAGEAYVNDKWMPKDNAKPRDLIKAKGSQSNKSQDTGAGGEQNFSHR